MLTVSMGFAALCAVMGVLAFIWPRRFSPCAPGLNRVRTVGLFLWLGFAAVLFCWSTVCYAYQHLGWTMPLGLSVLAAVAVTGCAVWNYQRAQKMQLCAASKLDSLMKLARAGWPGMDKNEILRHLDDFAASVDDDLEVLHELEKQKPGSTQKHMETLKNLRADIQKLRKVHS